MSDKISHPIFARVYARVASVADPRAEQHRRRLVAGLTGRVVEVGAGNGLNFKQYPATVTEVVAVEPEPHLRGLATAAAGSASVPVTVVDGTADALPLEDASVDAAVASLVLCSVPDQARALAELRRVIRPGGELRFYEHVLGEDDKTQRMQRTVGKVWPFFSGGCHVDRDTVGAIAAAGFEVESADRFDFLPAKFICEPVRPHVLGVARRRA